MRSRKYDFDGGQVEIAAELVPELDADGKQLRVVKLTDYTAEKVRTLFVRPDRLRHHRAAGSQRAHSIHELAERGIDFQQVTLLAGMPDADLCERPCVTEPLLTTDSVVDAEVRGDYRICRAT
ncbi:MAG: hypothetical protein HYY24_13930 [Verrucomicrobia bacterium]|nr:hypothetical protein [Verrucomicrobiota bacterium]